MYKRQIKLWSVLSDRSANILILSQAKIKHKKIAADFPDSMSCPDKLDWPQELSSTGKAMDPFLTFSKGV